MTAGAPPAGTRRALAVLRGQWRRWRKYPLPALAAGAAYAAWRRARRLLRGLPARPPPGAAGAGGSLPAPPADFGAALAARLGLRPARPGAGVPADPPFAAGSWDAVVSEAERIRAHEFDLMGSGPVRLGQSIDWSTDFKTGVSWPFAPASRVPRVLGGGSDIKVPWELGRFVHLAPLVRAYALTGNPAWAEEIWYQVDDFITRNPVGWGVQWASAMDVAIRAVNWTYALLVVGSGDHLHVAARERWLGALWEHGCMIRGALSWNPHSRGNHYLSELVGLLHVGLVFGWSRRGRRLARFAARRIQHEMRHQVYSEGTDHEASTNYHRLVTELLALAAGRWRRTAVSLGLAADLEFDRRLDQMFAFVDGYTRPDGTAPLFGDVDDGRVLALATPYAIDPRAHRESLAVYRTAGEPTQPPSAAWPEAGFFALRGAEALVLVRCGPVGLNGRGAHDHADQLSVDITLGGVPLIVDPGSYVYTADAGARCEFRSTRAHNTVTVDGRDQCRFSDVTLFEVEEGARGVTDVWEATADGATFEGHHDGYLRLSRPVVHRRRVRLGGDGRVLRIRDVLEGPSAAHDVRVTFQCDHGTSARVAGDRDQAWASLERGGRRFRLVPTVPAGLWLEVEDGWVSPRYGVRHSAPRVVLHGRVAVPVAIEVELSRAD